MTYTDQQLLDFLKGALDDESCARIEQTMRVDRDLERRVMALDPVAGPVRDAMKLVPGNPVLKHLTLENFDEPKVTPRRRSWPGLAAALIAGAIFGAATVWLGQPAAEDWRSRIAQYQSLYVVDTVRLTIANPEVLNLQLGMASERLGKALSEAALDAPSAISLARVQVLGLDEAPLIQIVYQGADGTPFALCITTSDNQSGKSAPVSEHLHGLATTAWTDENFRYILVGGDDTAVTQGLAQELRALL